MLGYEPGDVGSIPPLTTIFPAHALPLALEPSGPPALDFSPHAHVSPCPHAPSRLRRAQANR
jgi:hypothetical protein